MEEARCKGTPHEIAEAITAQRATLGFFVDRSGLGESTYIVSHGFEESVYLLHIHLPFALIGPAPNGQSLLMSRAEGDPKLANWWELLIAELGRLGWLAEAERDEGAAKKRGKGGRPRDPDKVWAWKQVNVYKRDETEVYEEWMNRPDVRSKHLVEPRDSFRHAINAKGRNAEETE